MVRGLWSGAALGTALATLTAVAAAQTASVWQQPLSDWGQVAPDAATAPGASATSQAASAIPEGPRGAPGGGAWEKPAYTTEGTLSIAEQAELVAPRDPHSDVFKDNPFPSAVQCAECHQKIFWEWASSNHAYASISPMFHKFEQRINDLASGTINTFCVRCHQQIGTQLNEPRWQALWERSQIAREGITCVTCHRVNEEFNKVNGQRHVQPGTIYEPMYNSGAAEGANQVLADPERYKVSVTPDMEGSPMHAGAIEFPQIKRSDFCVSCHQVAVHPGIKLEVVWEQYRASPAAEHGITCQQCHMGKRPGIPSYDGLPKDHPDAYDKWPVAIVNGRPIGDMEADHHNHAFYGPGYPIAHPGIFPFNPRGLRWPIATWLKFDHRTPWGVPEWEDQVAKGLVQADFPPEWADRQERESARYVIDQNLRMLELKRQDRIQVMENGSRIDGPFFDGDTPRVGESLRVRYRITNTDEGHNLPSGSLGAQPEIWFNVSLTDPDGVVVWESGYVDRYGDMADLHSIEYAEGTIPHDDQLVNLQTKFLVTGVKGPDREMYLPVNFDIDQIPHIRPSGVPSSVLNHPPFIRMEGRSIPPLGYRDASYRIPASAFSKPGRYRLQSRLRSRAEPIYFMKFVFATDEMIRTMNEWMIDIHPSAVEFDVN